MMSKEDERINTDLNTRINEQHAILRQNLEARPKIGVQYFTLELTEETWEVINNFIKNQISFAHLYTDNLWQGRLREANVPTNMLLNAWDGVIEDRARRRQFLQDAKDMYYETDEKTNLE